MKLFREEFPSKKQAVERLRLVLVHDRAQVSTGLLELLREEIITAISKYVDIDEEELEIELNATESKAELVANIPVVRVRRPLE
ncbi:MAG TPA: cell division topological specificity factor MinE [Firmicutes bacterium]|jgi:cell division topological specificity factor|nr:cell division topological specificity factor MinE [Bacillota bacterium]HBR29391.1 cell division topological specificity factor MinE [Bacillota bacterium]HBR33150.1 cell division topological specificity factor MinE [Bacillota bacterium]